MNVCKFSLFKLIFIRCKCATDNLLELRAIEILLLLLLIDEQTICNAAMKTRGSAGPSGMDAELYRRVLCERISTPKESF